MVKNTWTELYTEQGRGGLNENVPQRLRCLNNWSPVGGIWLCLSGMAFLEKVCPWGQALRFQNHTPSPVASVHHFMCLLPAAMMDSHTLGLEAQINPSFSKLS